jgi:hypothetical protein
MNWENYPFTETVNSSWSIFRKIESPDFSRISLEYPFSKAYAVNAFFFQENIQAGIS